MFLTLIVRLSCGFVLDHAYQILYEIAQRKKKSRCIIAQRERVLIDPSLSVKGPSFGFPDPNGWVRRAEVPSRAAASSQALATFREMAGSVQIVSRLVVRPESASSSMLQEPEMMHLTPWDLRLITVDYIQEGDPPAQTRWRK